MAHLLHYKIFAIRDLQNCNVHLLTFFEVGIEFSQ